MLITDRIGEWFAFMFAAFLFLINIPHIIFIDYKRFGRNFNENTLYKRVAEAGIGTVLIVIPASYLVLTRKPFLILVVAIGQFLGLCIGHVLYIYFLRKKIERENNKITPPK